MYGPVIDQLIEALKCLPGVGPKSAQRMALHLLERNREGATALSEALAEAAEKVGRCEGCRTLTEQQLCPICASPRREESTLCVVETPADMYAIEQSGSFRGRYFVLLGRLSPIEGIGPQQLGIDKLDEKFASDAITEVILATNVTPEGEATAHFISERARRAGIRVSRIAHGVPMGGELEYVDGRTLAVAFSSRKDLF